MLTSLRKSSSVSSFSIACFTQCTEFLLFFTYSKCLFSVRLCQRIRLFALLTQGKGNRNREQGIGNRFSFHEFYNFLLFNFLILIFFEDFFFTHDNNPHPHPHPRPTTFSYTRKIKPFADFFGGLPDYAGIILSIILYLKHQA